MHLRRALLLFALVLGLSALAASVSPAPEQERDAQPPSTAPASPEPGSAAGGDTRTLEFDAGAREPRSLRARPGERIVISVVAESGGTVTIPKLGRTASAQTRDPARFDLLAPPAGRYDVLLTPPDGEPKRVGTLVTRG